MKNAVRLESAAPAFVLRAERAGDVPAREVLLDACFGVNRHARTCQKLRDGRVPAEGLAFTATRHGRLVGTLRLWHVTAGDRPALLLGPLAVDPACRRLGIGAALMETAIAAARARGHGAIVLLGDAPYYSRFGFSAVPAGNLVLPGPFERDRLMALALVEGALEGAGGMIAASGRPMSATPVRRTSRMRQTPPRHAA